jgi:hypothetical protein
MIFADQITGRFFVAAYIHDMRTAGVEPAAGWGISVAGNAAGNTGSDSSTSEFGYGIHQASCIRM